MTKLLEQAFQKVQALPIEMQDQAARMLLAYAGVADEIDQIIDVAELRRKPWDIRWNAPNPHQDDPEGQFEALGRDPWTWICRALAS